MSSKLFLMLGDTPEQIALAYKLSQQFNLSGIVLEQKKSKSLGEVSIGFLFRKAIEKTFYGQLDRTWIQLQAAYQKSYPECPNIPLRQVDDINSNETLDFYREVGGDLIVVSGTSLIKGDVLELNPKLGFVNLHTGLSPYVKGGPNCTNWCLANAEFYLIGNTVMWLDAGIDSGNIISTECVDFKGSESLYQLHEKVMESSHNLYMRSIQAILENPTSVPSVPQASIAKGNTYYNRMWGLSQKRSALSNMAKFQAAVTSNEYKLKREGLTTISLPD